MYRFQCLNQSSTELTADKLATCVDENYNVESNVGSNRRMIMKVDIDVINISKGTRSIVTILYHESMTDQQSFHTTVTMLKHARLLRKY